MGGEKTAEGRGGEERRGDGREGRRGEEMEGEGRVWMEGKRKGKEMREEKRGGKGRGAIPCSSTLRSSNLLSRADQRC
eukprot:767203-Hanusia_phi.AAC.7